MLNIIHQVQKFNSATVYFHVVPVIFVAIFLGSWWLVIISLASLTSASLSTSLSSLSSSLLSSLVHGDWGRPNNHHCIVISIALINIIGTLTMISLLPIKLSQCHIHNHHIHGNHCNHGNHYNHGNHAGIHVCDKGGITSSSLQSLQSWQSWQSWKS